MCTSGRDRDDLAVHFAAFHNQSSDSDRQLEPPWPGAPRIEVKDTLAGLYSGSVTVPIDDDFESGGLWFQIELRQIVQNKDRYTAKFDDFSGRQFTHPCSLIHVAANSTQRRDASEFVQDFGRPYIPRMDDVFRAAQRFQCFRSKQAMRVGNDADENGISCPCLSDLSFRISIVRSSTGSSPHEMERLLSTDICQRSSLPQRDGGEIPSKPASARTPG